VVVVTAEGAFPVAIVVVIAVIVIVIVVIVAISSARLAMQWPACIMRVACFFAVTAFLFVFLGRHRSCNVDNWRKMSLCSPWLRVVEVIGSNDDIAHWIAS
jgi:hypothetical protein